MILISELPQNGLAVLSKVFIASGWAANLLVDGEFARYDNEKSKIRNELLDNYHPIYGDYWRFVKDEDSVYLAWVVPVVLNKRFKKDFVNDTTITKEIKIHYIGKEADFDSFINTELYDVDSELGLSLRKTIRDCMKHCNDIKILTSVKKSQSSFNHPSYSVKLMLSK